MPQPIMKKYKQGEMGMEYGMPSKEKFVNGYKSLVGKYSFEWNGKSSKI